MTDFPRLTNSDRYKLRSLKRDASQIIPLGRLAWCKGRKIVSFGSIADLVRIPREVDGVMLAPADHAELGKIIVRDAERESTVLGSG